MNEMQRDTSDVVGSDRGRWHLKCIAVVVVCTPLPWEEKWPHCFINSAKTTGRESVCHLWREQETIPVMAHCVHDKHNEPSFLGSFWLPGVDNVLVKYSSNYYRWRTFLVLWGDISNAIQYILKSNLFLNCSLVSGSNRARNLTSKGN